MNEGQFQALWSELKRMNGQLDEIRRAANRVDGRLKDAQPPIIIVDGDASPEQIRDGIHEVLQEGQVLYVGGQPGVVIPHEPEIIETEEKE